MSAMSDWFRTYGFADVHPELVIGAYPLDADDVAMISSLGVQRVLNLVQDAEYAPGQRDQIATLFRQAGIEEWRMMLIDYGHLPADELEQAVEVVLGWLRDGQRCYVHCRAGWQRSAAVAAGAIALSEGIDIEAALDLVRQQKPSANPLPHQRADLVSWWQEHRRAGKLRGEPD